MADFVVVKYFLNRHYAGLAQGLLGDGNVESFIEAGHVYWGDPIAGS